MLVLTHGLVNLITHRANEICFDLLGICFLLELQGLRLQLLLQLDGQQRLLPALLSVSHYKFPQSSQIALKTVDRALHVHTRSFCTLVRCMHSTPLEANKLFSLSIAIAQIKLTALPPFRCAYAHRFHLHDAYEKTM